MNRVSTYLNFQGNAEEAFRSYASSFESELTAPIQRFGDMPSGPGVPELSESERQKILHVELVIVGGHVIMGTDMLESLGHILRLGNNTTLNLELDTTAEADKYFAALSEGGSDIQDLQDMPWGLYWGCCLDRFGVRWMFNVKR